MIAPESDGLKRFSLTSPKQIVKLKKRQPISNKLAMIFEN